LLFLLSFADLHIDLGDGLSARVTAGPRVAVKAWYWKDALGGSYRTVLCDFGMVIVHVKRPVASAVCWRLHV
jgi:hypothetical protein